MLVGLLLRSCFLIGGHGRRQWAGRTGDFGGLRKNQVQIRASRREAIGRQGSIEYPPITEDEQEERDEDIPQPKPPRFRPPPPITIDNVNNSAAFLKQLQNMTQENLMGRIIGKGLRVYPKTPQAYHKIRSFIDHEKLESYTYQLNEEKELKVVIRGMPSVMPPQQIIEGLSELGLTINDCHVMINRKTGLPMPLFLLSLPKNESNKDVYNCGKPHLTSDCKKPKDTKATCCHCQGNHPANFSGCPKNPLNKPPPPPKVNFWDERTRKRKEEMEARKQQPQTSISAPVPPASTKPKPQPTAPQPAITRPTPKPHPEPEAAPQPSSPTTSQEPSLTSTLKELQSPKVVKLLTTLREIVRIANTDQTEGEKAIELCELLGINF
ncbi:nucleic-acid-binding protein from transposon X-element [Trichonephila clavipes]|nr:nucleic-acid-binding protein from transposon X-element [Trichonephila clavipes]